MWWKSKGWPDEKYSSPTTSNNSLNPALTYYGTKTRVKFTGSCLKQYKITFTHKNVVNIYIVYGLGASGSHDNNSTLKIRFSFPVGGFGQNVIIFGVDMSSSAQIDYKKKDILIPGKGPTQGLEHTLTAEKMYSISFTVTGKKFCLSLHYNGANITYLSMVLKLLNSKQKILRLLQLHCV